MERLTKRSDFTGLILIDGRGYGEAYFGKKEDHDRITKALEKLAAYEDAEEQGRLVVLPKDTEERIDKLEDLLCLSKSCLERKKKALEGMG